MITGRKFLVGELIDQKRNIKGSVKGSGLHTCVNFFKTVRNNNSTLPNCGKKYQKERLDPFFIMENLIINGDGIGDHIFIKRVFRVGVGV